MTRHKEEIQTSPPLANCQHSTIRLAHTLSAADLGTETGLDGGDGTTGSAGVASNEIQTVLSLVELGVGAAARLACDVLNNIATQNRFDTLLLESSLDDQATATVDTA